MLPPSVSVHYAMPEHGRLHLQPAVPPNALHVMQASIQGHGLRRVPIAMQVLGQLLLALR